MPLKILSDRAATARAGGWYTLFLLVFAFLLGAVIRAAVPPLTHILLAVFCLFALVTLAHVVTGLWSWRWKLSVASLVGFGLALAIFIPFTLEGYRSVPQKTRLIAIEQAVEPVCSGGTVPDAGTYTPGSGPLHLVAIVANSFRPISPTWLAEEYLPESVSDLELVVCIGPKETQSVETCRYSDGSVYVRNELTRTIQVIAPLTGEVVASTNLVGSKPPKACPSGKSAGGDGELNGSDPGYSEVMEWLGAVLLD